jgi:hypothetical protein
VQSSTVSGRPKRFRCHNCDKLTVKNPAQPKQRFCCDACRYEYNKHGAAFGPLRSKLEKLVHQIIRDEVKKLDTQLSRLSQRVDNFRYPEYIDSELSAMSERIDRITQRTP